MTPIQQLLQASAIHPEWQQPLGNALRSVDSHYLQALLGDAQWLPGIERLFSAFRRDFSGCRYILFGESPYPRRESANGIAFYDAAVDHIWSESGLSKAVNRATSLRNILKTALRAEGLLQPDSDGKITQPAIARLDKQALIQTLEELFDALQQRGFLLFNATPVLHPIRKPQQEAAFWRDFIDSLLQQVASKANTLPTLVLWGKIAQQIESLESARAYPKRISEHPYNLSFIDNPAMQALFAELKLMKKPQPG